ncbi:MAG: hypothetical protein DRO73_06705 [Candidatus Thorarchaeota archaeon]|nr:MAG: hypothetical protein DRO73_06705 [Candidatus Thorarchaeota archaeon]
MQVSRIVHLVTCGEYAERGIFNDLLRQIGTGRLEPRLRRLVLEAEKEGLEKFREDPEEARLSVNRNYAEALMTVRKISADDELLDRIEAKYGPVVASNFTYALSVISQILPVLSLTAQMSPLDPAVVDLAVREALPKLDQIVMKREGVPNAVEIGEGDGSHRDILAVLVLSFNFGMLTATTFLVVALTENDVSLTEAQVRELEYLLRDWPQETIAQFVFLNRNQSLLSPSFRVRPVPLTDEDLD